MNCRHCSYPLWNLRSGQCPECGTGFAPSDFRFSKNSVCFCCPHCDQRYFGTGPDGHLEPRRFVCVGCGQQIEMDTMVLRPADGLDERRTRADVNPWLDDRARFLKRLLGTMVRGPCSPGWLMRSTPVDSPPEQAWAFAGALHLAFAAILVGPALLLSAFVSFGLLGAFAGMFVGGVIALVVLTGLWVLTAHGMLRLGGATEGGLGRTAHALCYTCGPNVVVLVPCLNFYFGWIGTLWWIVAAGIALASAQRVSGVRAAIAVAVLPVVVIVAAVGFTTLSITRSINAANVTTMYGISTTGVYAFRLPLSAAAERGAWPAHAAELLDDSRLSPRNFTNVMSMTTAESDVFIDTIPLAAWESLTPEGRQTALAAAAATIGPDVVALRFGDIVFTYHGIDASDPPPGLWLVIEAWDPRVAGQPYQSTVAVLLSDGTTTVVPRPALAAALGAQNQLRASFGLAPLPDPFTVRQDRPARAPVTGPNEPDPDGLTDPDD